MTRKRRMHSIRLERWVERLLDLYEEMNDRGLMAYRHESCAVRNRQALGIVLARPGLQAWRTPSERAAVHDCLANEDLRAEILIEALKLAAAELRRFSMT